MPKSSYFFISPHLDDAVFSAGALISSLTHDHHVTIATIFTRPGSENTLSAKAYLKQCHEPSSTSLYKKRVNEDIRVLAKVGIVSKHLGFTEALWRRVSGRQYHIPELNAVYPTYRYHIARGRISHHDGALISQIAKKLKQLVKDKHAKIYCPVGHGHIDHLVTRLACEAAFGQSRLIYWLDFPYSLRSPFNAQLYAEVMQKSTTREDYKRKLAMAQSYRTQYSLVVPSDKRILGTKEIFYKPTTRSSTYILKANSTHILERILGL